MAVKARRWWHYGIKTAGKEAQPCQLRHRRAAGRCLLKIRKAAARLQNPVSKPSLLLRLNRPRNERSALRLDHAIAPPPLRRSIWRHGDQTHPPRGGPSSPSPPQSQSDVPRRKSLRRQAHSCALGTQQETRASTVADNTATPSTLKARQDGVGWGGQWVEHQPRTGPGHYPA